MFPEFVGKRDGVAVQIQHERGEAFHGDGAEAERGGERHGGERVRGVEFAVDNFIADGGPAEFAAQLHVQSEFAEQPQLQRHHQRRAIRERHKAQPQRARQQFSGHLIFFVHFGIKFCQRVRNSRERASSGFWRDEC